MALYDIDKSSVDRATPTPNSSDQIIDGASKAHGTNSQNYVSDASRGTGQFYLDTNSLLQPVASGNFTISKAANTDAGSTTVAHQLSFVPGVDYFVSNGATVSMAPYISFVKSGAGLGLVDYWLEVYSDATFVTFVINTPNVTGGSYASKLTISGVYYLFRQNAQVPPTSKG